MSLSSITIVTGPALRAALGADELAGLLSALGDVNASVHEGPLATAPWSDLYLAPATVVDELPALSAERRARTAARLLLLGAPRASALALLEQHGLLGAVEATTPAQWATVEDAWLYGRRDLMAAMDGVASSLPAPTSRYALWRHPLLGSLATLVAAYARRADPDRTTGVLPDMAPPWKTVEWLRGESRYGQVRAIGPAGRRAVATLSRAPATSADELVRQLAQTTPGVAPLLGAMLNPGDDRLIAVLEAEPAGLPLATPLFPLGPETALPIFGQLLAIIDAAGEAAPRLRTIRPELIYWTQTDAGAVLSGILPRCEDVVAHAAPEKGMAAALVYPFDMLFMSPEAIRARPPTATSPVFSACAVLLYLLHRRLPWQGDEGPMQQAMAVLKGPPPPEPALEPGLAVMIQAGLHPDPDKRPTATALRAALRASGVPVSPVAFLPAPPAT